MTALGGVDAGGSHTECVVSSRSMTSLIRRTGPAAAVRPDNIETAASHIVDTLNETLQAAGKHGVDALAVGAAGVGRPEERAALTTALEQRIGGETRFTVVTDGEIALEDAFPSGAPGILVLAGTGSVAFARDPRGNLCRSGGLGPALGDEGSGYALGRAALGAVTRAADNRGAATSLTEAIQSFTNTLTLDELVRWAHLADRETVASLALPVCRVADEGDSVARALVSEAALELARLAEALAHRFDEPEITVALAGSVLASGSPVRSALYEQLQTLVPRAVVTSRAVDPVRGALSLAATLLE